MREERREERRGEGHDGIKKKRQTDAHEILTASCSGKRKPCPIEAPVALWVAVRIRMCRGSQERSLLISTATVGQTYGRVSRREHARHPGEPVSITAYRSLPGFPASVGQAMHTARELVRQE